MKHDKNNKYNKHYNFQKAPYQKYENYVTNSNTDISPNLEQHKNFLLQKSQHTNQQLRTAVKKSKIFSQQVLG